MCSSWAYDDFVHVSLFITSHEPQTDNSQVSHDSHKTKTILEHENIKLNLLNVITAVTRTFEKRAPEQDASIET